jgi:hypothetical protein
MRKHLFLFLFLCGCSTSSVLTEDAFRPKPQDAGVVYLASDASVICENDAGVVDASLAKVDVPNIIVMASPNDVHNHRCYKQRRDCRSWCHYISATDSLKNECLEQCEFQSKDCLANPNKPVVLD